MDWGGGDGGALILGVEQAIQVRWALRELAAEAQPAHAQMRPPAHHSCAPAGPLATPIAHCTRHRARHPTLLPPPV